MTTFASLEEIDGCGSGVKEDDAAGDEGIAVVVKSCISELPVTSGESVIEVILTIATTVEKPFDWI